MADTKTSALTAAGSAAGANEYAINEAGVMKKVTGTQIAAFTSPAASDTVAGKMEMAVQSEMETATDVVRAVSPGRQQFHPSAAKFWVYWTANSTTILKSYNIDSIADTAIGDADGTITTDFSDENWAGLVCTNDSTTAGWDAATIQSAGFNARAAGTFGVLCGTMDDGNTAVGNLIDPEKWQVVGYGDQ